MTNRGFNATTVCKAITAKQPLPNNATLKLVTNRDGYWYFILDNGEELFETHSIMTPRLSDLSLTQWIDEGTTFIAEHTQ